MVLKYVFAAIPMGSRWRKVCVRAQFHMAKMFMWATSRVFACFFSCLNPGNCPKFPEIKFLIMQYICMCNVSFYLYALPIPFVCFGYKNRVPSDINLKIKLFLCFFFHSQIRHILLSHCDCSMSTTLCLESQVRPMNNSICLLCVMLMW